MKALAMFHGNEAVYLKLPWDEALKSKKNVFSASLGTWVPLDSSCNERSAAADQ